MITKGIIEKLIGKNKAKVRIPIYNKALDVLESTSEGDLCTATICTPLGMVQSYNKGDVIFLGFEEDQIDKPVILGQLQTDNPSPSTSDLTVDSLKVNVNYSLPATGDSEEVGGIPGAISTTGGSSSVGGLAAIQQQILNMQTMIEKIEDSLTYPVGSIYLTTINQPPSKGTWEIAAQSFILQFEGTQVPVYIFKRIS